MPSLSVISGAAVLLALAPYVMAVGSASVQNSCSFPVYYKVISTSSEPWAEIPAGGIHEPYSDQDEGFSIKLATTASDSAPITQFEYTWASGDINYDLSNINGYPFSAEGMEVKPSTGSSSEYPTCVAIDCPAGQSVCSAAYNAPDDTDTMVCGQNTSINLVLCSGSASKREEHAAHVHQHVSRKIRHPHGSVWVTI